METTDLSEIPLPPDEPAPKIDDKSDKELSWEKIAAEIAADAEESKEEEVVTKLEEETPQFEEATALPEVEEPNKEVEPELEPEVPIADVPVTQSEPEILQPEEALEAPPVPEQSEPKSEDMAPSEEFLPQEIKNEEDKEDVVIAEVPPEEVSAAQESEVEYTVMEADEEESTEIIEHQLVNSKSAVTETVVIINPDESQTEITIEQLEESERDDSSQDYNEEIYVLTKDNEESVDDPETSKKAVSVKPKKQRGRKSTSDIPLHVLGRDITKPIEGASNGGRIMPKPRLGVKVPYRNLTSQIVSKQEIEKEIMERFKSKQEQSNANSGDVLFARKLTQRLAKKLIPNEKDSEGGKDSATESPQQKSVEFQNDSDLLAILEGDGDDIDLSKEKQEQVIEKVKQTEREIALQQLRELPLKDKPIEKKKIETKVVTGNSPTKEKKQHEVEPRLKTGMVLKTYTRKRKSPDLESFLPPKKIVTTIKNEDGSPSQVYVTKSSRIIKRKIIWDPAEASSIKSPTKVLKTEPSPAKPASEKKEIIEKKVQAASPVKKIITPMKKPKRLTEVDRLLMDEGAVNMLYDVTNNDETSPKKKMKSVISLDKAHKELMSKTNVIKNDLQQNTNKDVQKSLRKKEILSPTTKKEMKKELTPLRKKSKDSGRSHSPPSSPSFNVAEASRIIRRHSSSSFSSMEEEGEEDGEDKVKVPKKRGRKPKEAAKNNNNTVEETKINNIEKVFTTTKRNKLVTIKLHNLDGKCYLNENVLKELTTCLKDFAKDDDCHAVAIVSDSNESFCEGLDYSELLFDELNVRKKKANELATLVKEYLKCLLNFPKVLVAGIQGDCVGLGVTMLPLFDLIIASDTATFTTPYCRFESVPEAGFLLGVPHLNSNGLANELLYTCNTVKADDAFRRGLVTKLCWPEKYQQELKTVLQQIAGQSLKCIMATKKQMRQDLLDSTESALSSMTKVLVEYWTSSECQESFIK